MTLAASLPPAHIVQLRSGPIEVHEAGNGPPLVFVHGALVSASVWAPVIERLSKRFRCIAPTLPLGSHRLAMNPDAELHPEALADIVLELTRALALDDVHLVGNDSGGAISQLAVARHPHAIASLVLTNCDALDVFPPRAFAYLKLLASYPVLGAPLGKVLHRFPRLGLFPLAWGGLARELGTDDIEAWAAPTARDHQVREDLAKFFRGVSPELTRAAAQRMKTFDRPVSLVWGTRDPFFELSLARRLASLLPDATIDEIDGARTYVMLDEPDRVATAIAAHFDRTAKRDAARPELRTAS